MMMKIRKNHGVTLMELMLALVVIVVLMFMAVRYYSVARENVKVAETVHRINLAVDASYKWLEGQNQKDFTGITAQKLVDTGLLSEQDTVNPWGGRFDKIVINGFPGAEQYVAIGYYGLPKTVCQSLKQKFMDKVQKINNKPRSVCIDQPKVGWGFWGAF